MIKENKFTASLRGAWNAFKQPLVAIVFGLLVGALVIIMAGEQPLAVYRELFTKSFFQPYYLMQTLTRSTPIIICAIAIAIAWRAGYINIGVEGQMVIGSFTATVCALYLPGPRVFVMIASILIGMVAGALYALIAAFLQLKFKVSLVIVTLMMNYIASFVTSYFVAYPLRDRSGDGLALQTIMMDEGLRFSKFDPQYTFNTGFIIAIVIVVVFIYVSRRTTFGYESKITGLNPNFAKYGGIKDKKVMLMTMALSGAVAAMAGVTEIFGVKYRFIDAMFTSTSYAWTGLMSALIASLHPVGIFFSSIFLGGLQVGGQSIQRTAGIPLQMSTLIQSAITLFVSVKVFTGFRSKRKTKKVLIEGKECPE